MVDVRDPELNAFLANIDPRDVATWRVLADWLEDRDDPRAQPVRAATRCDDAMRLFPWECGPGVVLMGQDDHSPVWWTWSVTQAPVFRAARPVIVADVGRPVCCYRFRFGNAPADVLQCELRRSGWPEPVAQLCAGPQSPVVWSYPVSGPARSPSGGFELWARSLGGPTVCDATMPLWLDRLD